MTLRGILSHRQVLRRPSRVRVTLSPVRASSNDGRDDGHYLTLTTLHKQHKVLFECILIGASYLTVLQTWHLFNVLNLKVLYDRSGTKISFGNHMLLHETLTMYFIMLALLWETIQPTRSECRTP